MVKFINYNGKDLPVRISYYALKMLQEKTGKKFGIGVELTFSDYEILLFHALERGHKNTQQEMTYTMEDMVDIMDECFFDFVKIIPDFFPTSAKKGGETTKK